MADPSVTFFGPLDTVLGPVIDHVLLGLAVVNVGTRKRAADVYRRQAADGADTLSRYTPHVLSTWLLVLTSLYYLTLHHHAGFVSATLALGLFLTDFFEFEARQLEVREDRPLERPKGAIAASSILVLYAAYQSLFFVVAPVWNAVI